MTTHLVASRRPLALLVAAAATIAVVAGGCTTDPPDSASGPDDTTSHPPLVPAGTPQPFRAASADLPDGWTWARCADTKARGNTGLAVRLTVPPGFFPTESGDRSCRFARSFVRSVSVSFGRGPTLKSWKEREVDPFTPPGQGDGQMSEVVYADDVPVYGDHRGEQLDYFCACDGQNLQERTVLARGVRVRWTTLHGHSAHEAEFDRLTDSVALAPGRQNTCTGGGRTAVYRPPVPQTQSIDAYQGICHLYLRPGRGSLQRMAEVVPAPTRTLDTIAAGLERRKRFIHDVRIEHGVATLDGQPADRLTWRFTRPTTSLYNEPAGTWKLVTLGTPDLQVTWGGRPSQWRQEAGVIRRFVDSVHLLPRRATP